MTITARARAGEKPSARILFQSLQIGMACRLVKAANEILDAVRAALFVKREVPHPRTVLVLRFGAIGDFVVALPALCLIRKRFPGARIALLTAPSLKNRAGTNGVSGAALVGTGLVDEKFDFGGIRPRHWAALREIRRKIRQLDPELCIFLPFSAEPFLGRLAKILLLRSLGARKNLCGFHTEASLGFLRRVQFAAGRYEHQLAATLRALQEAGIHDREVVFEIETSRDDVARVDAFWTQAGLSVRDRVIAICPASKEEVKCWPLENFRELGFRLLEDPRARIVILGGKEDSERAALLFSAWGERAVNFAGKTSLLQTAEVLRRCDIFAGVDSGPMHIAAALGVPVVGIFASVVFPVLWRPWSARSIQLRHSVPCEFCFTTSGICPTGTMECIRKISVAEVLEAVRTLLPMESGQPASARLRKSELGAGTWP